MRRVLVVRQDDAWQVVGEADLALDGAAPQVPVPEPPLEIEEVIREDSKATADVPISLSPGSSIVPAVPAGLLAPAVPCLTVATPGSQQPSGLLQQPTSGVSMLLSSTSRTIFESKMDREVKFSVFERILLGEQAPFVGTPDLRPGAMDTATNPTWLLFGWDHAQATFSSVYEVHENPDHGDHGF